MSESLPQMTFTPHASGDGTWYVEVASPGIASEHVGDFRSKASAEAWIRANQQSYIISDSRLDAADVKNMDGDAMSEPTCVPGM